MNAGDFSPEDQKKQKDYILLKLKEERALAYISKRLQDSGMSHDSAKSLIQQEALELSEHSKREGLFRLLGGAGGFCLLLIIGYVGGDRRNLYYVATGLFIGGIYMYFKSRKRLKYLKSIFIEKKN